MVKRYWRKKDEHMMINERDMYLVETNIGITTAYSYEVEDTDKWTYDELKNKIGDDVELFTPVEELNE